MTTGLRSTAQIYFLGNRRQVPLSSELCPDPPVCVIAGKTLGREKVLLPSETKPNLPTSIFYFQPLSHIILKS